MMPWLLGAMLAVGMLLVWNGLTSPPRARRDSARGW